MAHYIDSNPKEVIEGIIWKDSESYLRSLPGAPQDRDIYAWASNLLPIYNWYRLFSQELVSDDAAAVHPSFHDHLQSRLYEAAHEAYENSLR